MARAETSCQGCRDGKPLGFDFTMAFQPIVDLTTERPWGYEALVRGLGGESAASVLARVDHTNLYKFDQACRVKAIEMAGALFPSGGSERLSINFMPNAVYEPSACIRASLAAAHRARFDPTRLMFEFTEDEHMSDAAHVANIVAAYKRMGFTTAIDDFGAGYAGLNLLARFQPNIIKIDMQLIRGIESSKPRQAIVAAVVMLARQLDITVIAEGVETEAEAHVLRAAGINLLQGYFFAKPAVGALPTAAVAVAA
ncbi:MAG: diguanylate phosphodiesterase [Mesorhizobium amorphae]|nr:MAG: diguanylate phosphodiesterase [Mesorhizobium amorphae]